MNYDNFSKVANNQERDLEMSRAFPALMRKVYTWMAMALVITGVVDYVTKNSPSVLKEIISRIFP